MKLGVVLPVSYLLSKQVTLFHPAWLSGLSLFQVRCYLFFAIVNFFWA